MEPEKKSWKQKRAENKEQRLVDKSNKKLAAEAAQRGEPQTIFQHPRTYVGSPKNKTQNDEKKPEKGASCKPFWEIGSKDFDKGSGPSSSQSRFGSFFSSASTSSPSNKQSSAIHPSRSKHSNK